MSTPKEEEEEDSINNEEPKNMDGAKLEIESQEEVL